MLGIFKNRKKEMEVEAVKADAKGVGEEAKNELDELLDKLINDIVADSGLGTVLELKIFLNEKGLQITVGGAVLAQKMFCELGDGYDKVYENAKEKLSKIALEIKNDMETIVGKTADEVYIEEDNNNGNDL